MAQEEIDINTKPTKSKNARWEDMKNRWREKPLHGKYPLRTDNTDVDRATTHQWTSSSSLKGETEGFMFAAHDQSVSTRAYQSGVLNNGADPNCRLCTHREEIVDHIVSACPTIVNTEYLQIHEWVGSFIHLMLYKNLPHTGKWYKHTP